MSLGAITFAQDGDTPNECTRFKAIAGNAYKAKEYEKVTKFYMKALNECEKLELNFYGPFIYAVQKSYSKYKKDTVKGPAYLDTLIMVYEAGQEAHGMQMKWQSYLGFYYIVQGEPGGMQKGDEALKRGVHNQKEKGSKSFLRQYYANLYNLWVQEQDEKQKAAYKKRLIEEYFTLSDYATKGEMGEKTTGQLSRLIDKTVSDCASILPEINAFAKDLPQEVEAKKSTVKNFMALLESKDCTQSDEYAMLVDTIIAIDPSVDAVLAKAKLQISRGNTSGAIATFKQAVDMTENEEDKNDIELKIAQSYFNSRSYKAAHNAGIALGGKHAAKGYEIAAKSVNALMNDCGVSTFDRKANNYYAVELAQKSGNTSLVNSLKAQCPSSTDIFNEDKSVGDQVTLSCWGKTFTIKAY
ncbi:hypothetical protein CW751_13720 [Brumimicrobium salinarum]|uniref:Tetratricopeptide repeat protein n=2 Tax=Brumimicrobium salinarum TaxID=2058658 RepID=A0A2I0QZD6_9FLAO|nr:hypothetical protein CW751_13720 [Brumimicrobium salinarum]